MKKSLIAAALLCAALSAGASMNAQASGQAPPGIHAATSNKVDAVEEVNNQQPAFGGNLAPDGKTFVLTVTGQGITKLLPVRLVDAGCGDISSGGGSRCITPTLWRPAVDKVKAPPLIAATPDQNYTGRARLPATSLGEPPGAAVLT